MYKIKLTSQQVNKIYEISSKESTQKSLMSILAYLIKYTDQNTNQLTRSYSKLYTMYLRYHDKITRSYFFTLIGKLKDNNLLSVEDKKEDKKEDKIESPVAIETTSFDNNSEKPNNKIINNTNTYTLYTSSDVKAIDLVDEVLRDLKVRSKVIKTMVIAKLQNVVLDCKGAVAYIMKVITEKMEQYNTMKVNYAKKVAESKYSKAKSSFTGKKSNVIYDNVVATGFNNFKAREYDYADLEKRLLGWE